MKKALAMILSMIMIIALCACGGSKAEETTAAAKAETKAEAKAEAKEEAKEEAAAETEAAAEEPKKYNACCILQDSGGAAWGETRKSFIRGCEAKGWDYEFMAPTTVNSVPEMITLMENAISQGTFDLIICEATQMNQWADVVTRAREAGIVVVSLPVAPIMDGIDEAPETFMHAYCGFEADAVVSLEAELMDGVIPKDVQVTASYFHVQISDEIQKYHAFLREEFTKRRPDAVFLDMQYDDNNSSHTYDKIAALKMANPELNCIFGMDMGTALGIHNYIAEKDLRGQFWGVGVDASVENLATVKAGTVSYIIDQGYSRFGEQALDVAEKILNGEDYSFANKSIMTAVGVDNLDAWAEEMNLGEIPEI